MPNSSSRLQFPKGEEAERYIRAAEVLELYSIELHHYRRFEYVRLYPPGAWGPKSIQSYRDEMKPLQFGLA